jgi:hypothetical protein
MGLASTSNHIAWVGDCISCGSRDLSILVKKGAFVCKQAALYSVIWVGVL